MTFDGPIWDGVYSSFSEVPVTGPGFDGETWVNNSLKKIVALREKALESSPLPPVSNYREALLPLLAALILQRKGSVRILDYGGGIGFTYYQTFYALSQTSKLEYHIIEREAVCQAGRDFFGQTNKIIKFHSSIDIVNGVFDIVYMSSIIQYIDDWKELLRQVLMALSPDYLLLIDVFTGNIPTFATAQNYYGSKIPQWFLNIGELTKGVENNNYKLGFMSSFLPTILGVEQSLPMDNFEAQYRLDRTNNFLLMK